MRPWSVRGYTYRVRLPVFVKRALVLSAGLVLGACVGCGIQILSPLETDGDVVELETRDAGLRDGEMEPIVAQEWCWRWLCEDHRGEIVHRSCGGLDEYDCR